MRPIVLTLALAFICPIADADVLWYGGDWDFRSGLLSSQASGAMTYDDFDVATGGATVTHLFGHFATSDAPPDSAFYEIRLGVGPGNGGTLLAAGMTTASAVHVGDVGDRFIYRITVNLINTVALEAGKYWIGIAPSSKSADYHILTTSGANGMGIPLTNGNAFFDWREEGYNFVAVEKLLGPDTWDFSYGVEGFLVPEHGQLSVIAFSLFLLIRRKRG